jgi:hypothetical protein
MTRDRLPGGWWVAVLAAVVLIAAHAALFAFIARVIRLFW